MTIETFYNTITSLAYGRKKEKEVIFLTEEREVSTVVLQDEEGHEHEFEVADMYEIDGKEYAVLIPVDEEVDGEGNAFIFRVEEENGEDVLVDIEDDEEWNKVVEFLDAQPDLDEE